MLGDATSHDCSPEEPADNPFGVPVVDPTPLFCAGGSLLEGTAGVMVATTGLAILIAALASPSAPEPSFLRPPFPPGSLPSAPAPPKPAPGNPLAFH
jgi:hypothetical protein